MCLDHNYNRHILREIIYEIGDEGFRIEDVQDRYYSRLDSEGRTYTALGSGDSIKDFLFNMVDSNLLLVNGPVFRLNPAYQD